MKPMNLVNSITSHLSSKLRVQRRRATLVWLGAAICCSSFVFATVGHSTGGTHLAAPTGQPSPPFKVIPTKLTSQVASGPEVELVTVLPYGFEPAKITRPAGSFIFVMDNRSGLDDVSLTLKQESGPTVVTVLSRELTLSELDGYESLNLPPGHYVLREANHPEWTCTVDIAP